MNLPARNADALIRPMAGADLDVVQSLAAAVPTAPQWPRSAWLAAIDPNSTPRRIALVAASPHSAILGFAVVSLLPPQSELESIAIAPSARRRGLARLLVTELLSQIRSLLSGNETLLYGNETVLSENRSLAVTELNLEVRASNYPAIALYRSLGFLQMAVRSRYYTDPVEDAFLFRLLLGLA